MSAPPSETIDRLAQGRPVIDHQAVALVEAVVLGMDERGRLPSLLRPPRADRPGRLRSGAAIAGGGRGDVDFPARVGQANQCPAQRNSASSGWAMKARTTFRWSGFMIYIIRMGQVGTEYIMPQAGMPPPGKDGREDSYR